MRAVVAEIKTDKTLSDTTKEEIRDIMAVWRNRSGWTREEADLAVSILRHMALAEEKLELRDYTSCINALAKVPACSLAAENMLNYMEESGRPEIRPDRVTINTVIGAFAKSRDPCCARKAERLLLKLEKDYAGGDETRRPNQKSYGKVIDAYARSNQLEKAVDILRKVEQQFRLGNSDIEPSIHMYTTIIEGFANSGRRDAPEKAETVLNSLLELFDERKIDSLRPDKGLFSTVINAYSKSKHPCWGQKALSILKDMKKYDVEVTVKTYNLVISVLVSNGKVEDIERAEDLLRYLEETPDFVPDKYSYAPILEAYVRKNMPDRAERVLLDWASLYNSGIARHMPSSHNYKEVIRCWGRSDAAGSVEKVDRILKCMSEKTSRPMRAIPAE
jgi:pentatricopeptide repeat protein